MPTDLKVIEVGAVVRDGTLVGVRVTGLGVLLEALNPLVVISILVSPLRARLALALLGGAGAATK